MHPITLAIMVSCRNQIGHQTSNPVSTIAAYRLVSRDKMEMVIVLSERPMKTMRMKHKKQNTFGKYVKPTEQILDIAYCSV